MNEGAGIVVDHRGAVFYTDLKQVIRGNVWVANYDEGTIVRVDPRTGDVVSTIKVGGHPSGIAVGHGRVWVTVS